MAFITGVPLALSRATAVTKPRTALSTRRSVAAVRRSAAMMSERPELEKVPQGFTAFSEQLNGRAAMVGFLLAVVTEALTGKGILGQVGSIIDIVNLASALGN